MLSQPQQKTIHVVIVGLGEAAETHLSVLELFPNVDVIAGVDTLGGKLVKFHGQQIPLNNREIEIPTQAVLRMRQLLFNNAGVEVQT